MERHRDGYQRAISARAKSLLTCCDGQSTVEFALVLAGCLAVVIGLGALAGTVQDGLFVDHAVFSASHHVQGDPLGSVLDVLLF